MEDGQITVKGARSHNLKNISCAIPQNKLVVITGLSGSGKSSLAFDTLYAEGQRRYIESLSAYARQFLQLMQKPDVDSIDGLSPAIAIEQKTTSKNPRSTVGTLTEIYDYCRVLFARIGVPFSPETGQPIESQSISVMVDKIMTLEVGTKIYLMAPIVRGRKGEYRQDIENLIAKGYQRFKIDGAFYEAEVIPALNPKVRHTIDVVVDRLVVKLGIEGRIADTLDTCLKLSDGLALCQMRDTQEVLVFSERFSCPVSGFCLPEIEPRLFSFNSPYGACPACDGLGQEMLFSEKKVVPNPELSVLEGAIKPWYGPFSDYYLQTLVSVLEHYKISPETPFKNIDEKVKDVLLHGSNGKIVSIHYKDDVRHWEVKKAYEGVIPNIQRRWSETESERVRESLSRYQERSPCKSCHGFRLKPEALCVKINQMHIAAVCDLSIDRAIEWFQKVPDVLTNQQNEIAARLLKEIKTRLQFLKSVGLDYLALSRMAGTLSGGESQRIRLASQIGSGLTGVLYVLDEPSIGLHQRDNDHLLTSLKHLRDLGNSVIVVEHDKDAILSADYVIDMGPGAGINGGQIIAAGTPQDLMSSEGSVTGDYLSGRREISMPGTRRSFDKKRVVCLEGAAANNLQNVDAVFPLGRFVCVTGVSGGGKSSLVVDTLYHALKSYLGEAHEPALYKTLKGVEQIDKVIYIDQSPIGRTPRSNPATYTGVLTPIREWFSRVPEAKARGYTPSRFSFNMKGGRCEACRGDGVIKVEMHFLPDVYVTCDQCNGRRYNRETCEVKFKDKNIADVLDMTIDEAAAFFEATSLIRTKLETLQKVGLGYIKIGQQATTLSGGEVQRIKLSKELTKRATGKTVYILDEPTTGLHFEDIKRLLKVLHTLVDYGNTVIVIEHNLDVIKTADWLIDIGPEGGACGGEIIATGTPEEVAKAKKSYTGKCLLPYVNSITPSVANIEST